jgi:type I restriction enzyme S subunit
MRRDLLGRLAFGSTHKTIYWPDIEALRIPLPTLAEQREVLEQIDKRTGPLDSLREELKNQISLLKEHRQALVTAAVTGQLEVTEAA